MAGSSLERGSSKLIASSLVGAHAKTSSAANQAVLGASKRAVQSSAANGFIGSLAILIVALVAFGVVFLRSGGAPPQPSPKVAVAEDDPKEPMSRRRLRQEPRAEAPLPEAPRVLEQAVATSEPEPPQATDSVLPAPESLTQSLAIPIDPDVQKAMALVDHGQVQEAIASLESALKKDPRNEQALTELAMIYLLDLKQGDQAINYLQRAVDVNPSNQVVISELLSLYDEQNRSEDGLAFLIDQAGRHPESTDLAYGVGRMLVAQGRDGEAVSFLERAASVPDGDVHLYRDLAETYARTGEPERAVEAYSKAIAHQEKEISAKTAQGLPIAYAQERMNYTKMDKARELIHMGEFDQAQQILDDVAKTMTDDEALANLRESLYRRRAG